ncbi:MAG TPA: hypothetical protein PLJ60_04935 [Chryseolinea sp.]|nr:hypothetical protein [Chryseolinea sp.]HPM29663.1 hypothetical protein [Chryseolinea sp.]
MEKKTTSKKALRSLINDSMQEVISSLELPKPSKKVRKLINRNAKKIASIYTDLLKREDKKKRKEQKLSHDKVKANNKKGKTIKAPKKQELETA